MVNKSPNKNKNSKIQILDDCDIDGKSLHCYVEDGSEMNLTLRVCLRMVFFVETENFFKWKKKKKVKSLLNNTIKSINSTNNIMRSINSTKKKLQN